MKTRNEALSDERDAIQGTQMISWQQGVAAILAHLDTAAKDREELKERLERLERVLRMIGNATVS